MDELLTVDEVAEILKIKNGTVNQWVQRGVNLGPSFFKVGGSLRLKRSDLENYLEKCKNELTR